MVSFSEIYTLIFKLDQSVLKLIEKIKYSGERLCNYYEVTQGYIPYRKSDLIKKYGKDTGEKIIKNKEWHSSTKINNEYKEEIWGQSITKYNHQTTGSFIWYGKHLATYVDLKFFNQKRLLIREITNPTIIACIVKEEFVNDPQLINIIEKAESYPVELLWAILNSTLGTFYHFNSSPKATKGAFPKILIYDINNFPLPEISALYQQRLIAITNKILDCKKSAPLQNTSYLERKIDEIVFRLYNLNYEEAKMIEPNFWLTSKDYDKIAHNE